MSRGSSRAHAIQSVVRGARRPVFSCALMSRQRRWSASSLCAPDRTASCKPLADGLHYSAAATASDGRWTTRGRQQAGTPTASHPTPAAVCPLSAAAATAVAKPVPRQPAMPSSPVRSAASNHSVRDRSTVADRAGNNCPCRWARGGGGVGGVTGGLMTAAMRQTLGTHRKRARAQPPTHSSTAQPPLTGSATGSR